jgi:hypothetical protein
MSHRFVNDTSEGMKPVLSVAKQKGLTADLLGELKRLDAMIFAFHDSDAIEFRAPSWLWFSSKLHCLVLQQNADVKIKAFCHPIVVSC